MDKLVASSARLNGVTMLQGPCTQTHFALGMARVSLLTGVVHMTLLLDVNIGRRG